MKAHTHPCSHPACDRLIDCDAELVPNYDGFPEVVCTWFHERENGSAVCEHCANSLNCDECGACLGCDAHDSDCASVSA